MASNKNDTNSVNHQWKQSPLNSKDAINLDETTLVDKDSNVIQKEKLSQSKDSGLISHRAGDEPDFSDNELKNTARKKADMHALSEDYPHSFCVSKGQESLCSSHSESSLESKAKNKDIKGSGSYDQADKASEARPSLRRWTEKSISEEDLAFNKMENFSLPSAKGSFHVDISDATNVCEDASTSLNEASLPSTSYKLKTNKQCSQYHGSKLLSTQIRGPSLRETSFSSTGIRDFVPDVEGSGEKTKRNQNSAQEHVSLNKPTRKKWKFLGNVNIKGAVSSVAKSRRENVTHAPKWWHFGNKNKPFIDEGISCESESSHTHVNLDFKSSLSPKRGYDTLNFDNTNSSQKMLSTDNEHKIKIDNVESWCRKLNNWEENQQTSVQATKYIHELEGIEAETLNTAENKAPGGNTEKFNYYDAIQEMEYEDKIGDFSSNQETHDTFWKEAGKGSNLNYYSSMKTVTKSSASETNFNNSLSEVVEKLTTFHVGNDESVEKVSSFNENLIGSEANEDSSNGNGNSKNELKSNSRSNLCGNINSRNLTSKEKMNEYNSGASKFNDCVNANQPNGDYGDSTQSQDDDDEDIEKKGDIVDCINSRLNNNVELHSVRSSLSNCAMPFICEKGDMPINPEDLCNANCEAARNPMILNPVENKHDGITACEENVASNIFRSENDEVINGLESDNVPLYQRLISNVVRTQTDRFVNDIRKHFIHECGYNSRDANEEIKNTLELRLNDEKVHRMLLVSTMEEMREYEMVYRNSMSDTEDEDDYLRQQQQVMDLANNLSLSEDSFLQCIKKECFEILESWRRYRNFDEQDYTNDQKYRHIGSKINASRRDSESSPENSETNSESEYTYESSQVPIGNSNFKDVKEEGNDDLNWSLEVGANTSETYLSDSEQSYTKDDLKVTDKEKENKKLQQEEFS